MPSYHQTSWNGKLKEPIKQMATLKAFEPDEMPSIFLPAQWAWSW